MTSIHQYDDIINMSRPGLKRHSRMPVSDRAAQFQPFAALNGYASVIEEASRITDSEIILDEYEKADIDRKLNFIKTNIEKKPEINLVYFLPDKKKSGGSFQTFQGNVKGIDIQEKKLSFECGLRIDFDSIIKIRSIEK